MVPGLMWVLFVCVFYKSDVDLFISKWNISSRQSNAVYISLPWFSFKYNRSVYTKNQILSIFSD